MIFWLVLTTLAASAVCAAVFPQYAAYPADYDDYYLLPKPVTAARYPYYPAPAYDEYRPYYEEDPRRLEERAAREAALPVGQETWYESEPPAPRWRAAGIDDVNAAFLQNLIITQMARNAENRARALAPPQELEEEDSYDQPARQGEDEDVRELKALAGKPFSHAAKTEPRIAPTNNYEYYDYPADESFINWGSKRAATERPVPTTVAPTAPSTAEPSAREGQREEVMLRPATPVRHPFPDPVMKMLRHEARQEARDGQTDNVYDTIKHLLAADPEHKVASGDRPRLQKRFVATENDLVAELRGLKRRIST